MTCLSVTRSRLAGFRRLPPEERRLLLAAAAWLPLVDLALRTLGFARVRRLLARGLPPAPALAADPAAARDGAAARRAEVETVARLVGAAARHHVYPVRCLPRSLVLWRFLARRGIRGDLRIGVRKDETELHAHAWVEWAGRPLAEPGAVERSFAPLGLPSS